MNSNTPDSLPLLGIRKRVLFPGALLRLTIGKANSVRLVESIWDASNRTFKKGSIIAICTVALTDEEIAEDEKKNSSNQESSTNSNTIPPKQNNKPQKTEKKKGFSTVLCDETTEVYSIGCAAKVLQLSRVNNTNGNDPNQPSYQFTMLVEGISRIHISDIVRREPYLIARVKWELDPIDSTQDTSEVRALSISIKQTSRELLDILKKKNSPLGTKMKEVLESIERAQPGRLADILSANMEGTVGEKQEVLAEIDLASRLRKSLELVNRQVEILKMSEKIQSQVEGKLKNSQREYYLRQQLKAINDELNQINGKSGGQTEVDEMEQLESTINKLNLSSEVRTAVNRELSRIRAMQPSQPEYSVIRTYLEWISELPWSEYTNDNLDIIHAQKQLDDDHYSLEKVKKRMIEFLAVRSLKTDSPGPILCLVGPPGVGKTSLGRSIATALGRKFRRIALGGVRDEAEIRGHRRTYIGALPGNIISALKKAGSANPVILLDEIDKLGRDVRGDPGSALLEVLDPEQNGTFTDHYLNVPFDLSRVLFICTANDVSTIPPPLLDRMELIEVSGYTMQEKSEIALRHLIPKQMERHGITNDHLEFSLEAANEVISSYTREAGVRNLDREIAAICRQVAVSVAESRDRYIAKNPKSKESTEEIPDDITGTSAGAVSAAVENTHKNDVEEKEDEHTTHSKGNSIEKKKLPEPLLLDGYTKVVLNPELVHHYLGIPKYESEVASRISIPGVSTGMAWTQVGGEILFIEVSLSRGSGRITLTGRMGQVMEESVKAALSFVRSNLGELGLYDHEDMFGDVVEGLRQADLHVHIPSGGVPKDGPSAGVAITAAIISAISGRCVRPDTACTGEITLRGLVLPVGGIKEKVLAAHRAGIRRIVLPSRNKSHASEIPENVRKELQIIFVSNIMEAMNELFEENTPERSLPLWRVDQQRRKNTKGKKMIGYEEDTDDSASTSSTSSSSTSHRTSSSQDKSKNEGIDMCGNYIKSKI